MPRPWPHLLPLPLLLLLLTPFPLLLASSARLLELDSDILEAQELWKQYRNIVRDGFFLNDSMIVMADDYSDYSEEDTHNSISGPGDRLQEAEGEGRKPVREDLEEEDTPEDGGEAAAPPEEVGGFESVVSGMVSALAEIQSKGDLMLGAIRGQRQLLYGVREEVGEAEVRLGEVRRGRMEEEERWREAETGRLQVEERTRLVQLERQGLEREVERVEREREEVEARSRSMRSQVVEMEESLKEQEQLLRGVKEKIQSGQQILR